MGIPVFLSATNNEAPITAAIIASICSNTKTEVDFYIIDGYLSHANKHMIEGCRKLFNNFTIDYIRLDFTFWLKKYPDLRMFDKDAFAKYIIPTLRADLDKAICLDKDMIFAEGGGDIYELYQTDLQGFNIAAVPLTTLFGDGLWSRQKLSNYAKLNLSSKSSVFDPGLLLIDIKKWNKECLTDKLLNLTKTLASERKLFNCYDGIFMLFDGRYLKLDKSWNVPYHYAKIFYFNKTFEPSEIKALHFNYTGDNNKPWNNKNLEGSDFFWKYVALTRLNTILEKKPPSRINDPQYWLSLKYKRKIINLLIKLTVSRRKYKKLKRNAEQFFADSKSKFIRFLGELYF